MGVRFRRRAAKIVRGRREMDDGGWIEGRMDKWIRMADRRRVRCRCRSLNKASEKIENLLEIGFLDRAVFQAELESLRVGWDPDGRNFEQFLLQIFPAIRRVGPAVFPQERNETDADRIEEFAF